MRQVLPSSKFIHSGVGGNDLVEDFAKKLRTFLKKIKIKFKISFVVEIDILIRTKEKDVVIGRIGLRLECCLV